ncbi:MAG: glycosyltransferase family A protein [Pseudomonadota bacterium]
MQPVSVIIPTFNRAQYLRPCIEAVLGQSLAPAEVLIVDDGSTDDTARVVESFGDAVRYIHKQNSGKSASLNLAMQHVSHPLIWIMDDDDIAEPTALEDLARLLEQNPDAGMAYGRFDRFTEDADTGTQTFFPTHCWVESTPDTFLISVLEDCFVHQPGMLVKRAVYDATGPFDVEFVRSQDYEMLVRIARITTCVHTDNIVFHQRQHDGARGQSGATFGIEQRVNKWVEFDQRIFEPLYEQMPLEDFLPRGMSMDTTDKRRRALLQRAAIMGRRKLWALAVDDLKAAAALSSSKLTSEERSIIRGCFGGKHGCTEVASDPAISSALLSLKDVAPSGPAISRTLSRGLVWRLRETVTTGHAVLAKSFGALALSLALPRLNPFKTVQKPALNSSSS